MRKLASVVAAVALTAAACSQGADTDPGAASEDRADAGRAPAAASPSAASPAAASPAAREPTARRVDPRRGGFEIGFGEFALALEAEAIRPGPVTFVLTNGGKMVHGFEMEIEGIDDDNSGSGGGDDDGFKVEGEPLSPGESARFRLDLTPGLYKVECFVEGHDDLGMEAMLEVRPDAPLVRVEPQGSEPGSVMISGFAFDPEVVEVPAGTTVTWMNHDPEQHTVTAEDGAFGSDPLDTGARFRFAFEEPGTYAYICAIHPAMKGTVEVA